MTNQADKIVVMSKQSDQPEYVKNSNKLPYWEIENPEGQDYEYHILMRDQIDTRIKNFIRI